MSFTKKKTKVKSLRDTLQIQMYGDVQANLFPLKNVAVVVQFVNNKCLVDNSPSLDTFLREALDHFASKVVYRLHLCGLEGQLARLGPL